MRRACLGAALFLLLNACQTGPVPTLYKAGSTHATRQAAYDACKIASFKEIPQKLASEKRGGYYSPGWLDCRKHKDKVRCERVGAVHYPPETITYDVNDSLRQRYVQRCLVERGFQIVDRPVCATQKERSRALNDPQPGSASQLACSAGTRLDG